MGERVHLFLEEKNMVQYCLNLPGSEKPGVPEMEEREILAHSQDTSEKEALRAHIWSQLRSVARPDSRFHWNFAEFIADYEGSEIGAGVLYVVLARVFAIVKGPVQDEMQSAGR